MASDDDRSGWKWYWLVWFLVALMGFLVPEGIAIFNGTPGDTLTEVSVEEVWSLIGPELTVFALGSLLFGGGGWLIYHFVRRIKK
jgi:hypothetical protein